MSESLPVTPVFLFSLPRSGSTLVQRLLATHPQVATTSEPWILLPLMYSLKRPGVLAEYGHRTTVRAIEDFCDSLPAGREEYLTELRNLVLALYQSAAGDARYFVDKTPRYHLVAHEIMELFPDAKFIFLWRQPLAVAASMIEAFGDGRWNLQRYAVDLWDGVENLAAANRPNDPRRVSLRFEDVVADPQAELGKLFDFLGLDGGDADPTVFQRLMLPGRMGRPGIEQYSTVSAEPLDKWRETMGSWFRKRWCRQYLERLGPHRLALMGYDYDRLMREVGELEDSTRGMVSDIARSAYGLGHQAVTRGLMYPSRRERQMEAQEKQRALAAERD